MAHDFERITTLVYNSLNLFKGKLVLSMVIWCKNLENILEQKPSLLVQKFVGYDLIWQGLNDGCSFVN